MNPDNVRQRTFGRELVNYDALTDPLVRRLRQLARFEHIPAQDLYRRFRQERRTRQEVLQILDGMGIGPEETDPIPGMESLLLLPWLHEVHLDDPDRYLDYLEALSSRPGIIWYWFAQSIAKDYRDFPWLDLHSPEPDALPFPYTREIWDQIFEKTGRDETKARQLFGDLVRHRSAFIPFWTHHRLALVERHHERLIAQRQEELEAQTTEVRQKAGRLLRFPDRSPSKRRVSPQNNSP